MNKLDPNNKKLATLDLDPADPNHRELLGQLTYTVLRYGYMRNFVKMCAREAIFTIKAPDRTFIFNASNKTSVEHRERTRSFFIDKQFPQDRDLESIVRSIASYVENSEDLSKDEMELLQAYYLKKAKVPFNRDNQFA